MNPIEHGTLRGWRQHMRRRTPACGPCADARRLEKQEQVDTATQHARQAWNRGMVGASRAAADTPVIETCTVDGCGSSATQPQPNAAMVGVAARWYCPGRCAAIGRALADLRSAS